MPSKIYEYFHDCFRYEFELNIFKTLFLLETKKIKLTSGPEIYLPVEFKKQFGGPLTGMLYCELVHRWQQEERERIMIMLQKTINISFLYVLRSIWAVE